MTTLASKSALVTGASRGIGRAIAVELAAAGARVVVHYGHNADAAKAVVDEIAAAGGRADSIAVDLADPKGPHVLATGVRNLVGERLDIVVANAGILRAATIEDMSVEDFDDLFAINVRAPYFLVQQLLPVLKSGSSVVFVSSLAGHSAMETGRISAYGATKGAIDTMTKHLALTLGSREIRVNAIAPGNVEGGLAPSTRTEEGRVRTLGMQALKRIAQPADIASVVRFLSSDDARWITGDIIHVDGGSRL
jgi:NAD(P)-dependent dehydrogenase (short-subunit alcohol dehydrogenase family)